MSAIAIISVVNESGRLLSLLKAAKRYAYRRPRNQALTLEEAKSCSEGAYTMNEGATTPDKKWKVEKGGVRDPFVGFRSVLFNSTTAGDRRLILAFAGTNSKLTSLRSTLDVLDDVGTDVYQALNMNPLFLPLQYVEGEKMARHYLALHGDRLIVTGHSLGGGIANFASLKLDIPGAGINAAPLGVGSVLHLLLAGKRGEPKFTHYNNAGEAVSTYAPGVQLGEKCSLETSEGTIDAHLLSNVNADAPMVCYGGPGAAGTSNPWSGTGATGSW